MKTLERRFDGAEDCNAGETALVDVVTGVGEVINRLVFGPGVFGNKTEAFGEDEEFFAGDVGLSGK